VVWASAHDNIYAYRNHEYQISDVIYIQFSKPMSSDVRFSSTYILNNNDLPSGTSVEVVDKQYVETDDDLTNENFQTGTMVTLILPHNQFGESHEWFNDDQVDPYAPFVETQILTIINAADTNGGLLTANPLTGTTRYTLEYNTIAATGLNAQADAVTFNNRHVTAYYNKTDFNPAYPRLASKAQVEDSDYVYAYKAITPYYDGSGVVTSTPFSTGGGTYDVTYDGTTPFIFEASVDEDGRSIPFGDGLKVIAHNAASITIDGDIDGDVEIESTDTKEIWINGAISGDLTITTPEATVYLDTTKTGAPVTIGTITIMDLATNTLVVGPNITITNLIIDNALDYAITIKLYGTIVNLVIGGSPTDGAVKIAVADAAKYNTLIAGVLGSGASRATRTSL
jgi:hypothetical protein